MEGEVDGAEEFQFRLESLWSGLLGSFDSIGLMVRFPEEELRMYLSASI